jgi:hypothetical protein
MLLLAAVLTAGFALQHGENPAGEDLTRWDEAAGLLAFGALARVILD